MSFGEDCRIEMEVAIGIAEDNAYRAIKDGVWTMRDGTKINLMDMTTAHIQNCIRMLRHKEDDLSEAWVKRFERELEYRDYVLRIVRGQL